MDQQLFDIKKFKRLDNIGEGSFSSVFKVKYLETSKILVAKILHHLSDDDVSLKNCFYLRELEIMSMIKYPTIVRCFGYSLTDFNNENNPVIFLEYMVNGSLDRIIKEEKEGKSPSNWNDTKKLINIYGISTAIMHLHSKGIIHRDIKPGNILEDENFYPKLADFGLARSGNGPLTGSVGTLHFMAPEVFEEKDYSNKIDVFSFGITIFLLLGGEIKIKSQIQHFNNIFKGVRPNIDIPIHESYKKLITQCWSQDPNKRPSFEEIVSTLKTDPSFLTDGINVEEFKNYVKYIDEWKFDETEEEMFSKRKEKDDKKSNATENIDTIREEEEEGKEEEEEEEEMEDDDEVSYSFRKGKPFNIDTKNLNIKEFKKKEKIGHGFCGDVFRIKNINTEIVFAAKIMRHEYFEEDKNKIESNYLIREVTILSQLVHPSIMKYYGYSATDFINLCRPVIITEYIKNGSLENILEIERDGFNITFWDDTMKLINIYGIASCMSYLHSLNIIHRDLKPSNVLIDEFLFPKLADFGFSKFLPQQKEQENDEDDGLFQSEQMGTKGFIAPEILSDCQYTKAGDVYSFGMLVYEMMAKEFPFYDKNSAQVMYAVLVDQKTPEFKNPVASHYKELIKKCWKQNPDERPTFDDIVNILENDQRFYEENVNKKLYFDYIQYIKQLKQEKTIMLTIQSDIFKQYSLKPTYNKYREEKSMLLAKGFVDIDKYVRQKPIRKNEFSNFYYVIDKMTGQTFIAEMSKFDIANLNSQEKENLLHEVDILSHLKCPTIQQVIGYSLNNFKHRPKPVIIREYSTDKTLYDIIEKVRKGEKNSKFTDTKKLIILYGIASGMSFLHSHDILHHELKTTNILVDDNLNPKVSEFGFYIKPRNSSRISSESHNLNNEIPYYISPEVLKSETPTKSSDVYSYAYIVYEIICNETPFNNIKSFRHLIDEVVNKSQRPTIKENIPTIYRELISSCWSQEPTERPTFSTITEYFRNNLKFIANEIDQNEFNNYIKSIEQ